MEERSSLAISNFKGLIIIVSPLKDKLTFHLTLTIRIELHVQVRGSVQV